MRVIIDVNIWVSFCIGQHMDDLIPILTRIGLVIFPPYDHLRAFQRPQWQLQFLFKSGVLVRTTQKNLYFIASKFYTGKHPKKDKINPLFRSG